MRKLLIEFSRFLLRTLILRRGSIVVYNWIFERSPYRLANLLLRLSAQPNFAFTWTIRLLNGRNIAIPVSPRDPRSWEFAHAYHWHDLGLKNIEFIMHGLIDIEAPFLDVGANMGVRSLLPLAMGRPCILFEPNRQLRAFTEGVFEVNGFDNYRFEHVCLYSENGTAEFFLSDTSYLSSLDASQIPSDRRSGAIEVPTLRLDDWLVQHPEVKTPGLIKIDVEGAELEVLRGAEKLLTDSAPSIIIEVFRDQVKRDALYNYLLRFDYSIYGIPNATKTHLTLLDRQSFLKYQASDNFLLVHDVETMRHLERFLNVSSG